ncbi:hypothetical protein, partial [Streptomyces sp. NPDC101166]|uniref:hypothetical protein n=1 Tax=Streptomyces sp. NPDC101166 TaxID=3366120 RepID=UPI003825D69E
TSPELVRAICEPNAAALLDVLDDTLEVLTQARDSLRANGTLAELTEAGHDARTDYEDNERWPITDISLGERNWLTKLIDAGRAGGVLTSLD